MAEYNPSEDRYSVPDNNTEEFEQQLQQKHIQQREQLEGGGPVEETGSIEEAGSTPTADSSTQPRETAKAVKGGKGDHSWGGYERQQDKYGLQKPANVSQEDWEARPEWSRGLENIVAAGSTPALGVADFVSDAAALVPFLKPVSEWWNANSPRSNHPAHKATRDAASIIIPTMYGGGVVTGSLRSCLLYTSPSPRDS